MTLGAAWSQGAADIGGRSQCPRAVYRRRASPRHERRQLVEAALRLWPNLRVLFTTGYARSAIIHHGRLDPGIDLIGKPITTVALAVKIRELLDKP